jgi:hypothetical protein
MGDGGITFNFSGGEPGSLASVINQAVGAASVSWENPKGAGEFDQRWAASVADALEKWIVNEWLPAMTSVEPGSVKPVPAEGA